MVSFPYPKQKGSRSHGNQHSKRQHDLPQRKTGPAEPESGAPVSQPHRPAGAKRRGQVHSDEAAGGRPAPHIRLHSGGRTAPSQDGAAAEGPAGLSSPGFRVVQRAHRGPVPGLYGRPEGAAGLRNSRPRGDPDGQSGGAGPRPHPQPVRRTAPAGGHRPGPIGESPLPDL